MTQETKELILVVEDDFDIRNLIVLNLRRKGFDVIAAETGEEGLQLAKERNPLLMTLDLMLPGIGGLDVCQEIRSNTSTRDIYIIMVTALGEDDDRITGLQVGADDYISKPFNIEELLLRVDAAVRRLKRNVHYATSDTVDTSVFSVGGLQLNQDQHRIWIHGEEVSMTITEYKLLLYLLQHGENLCSRAELLEKVWELPPNLNTRTVDTHIKRLRQKMGTLADNIETVRGAGYRFSKPV